MFWKWNWSSLFLENGSVSLGRIAFWICFGVLVWFWIRAGIKIDVNVTIPDAPDSLQYTTYYGDGGHYDWHVDGGSDHNSVYTKENTKWRNYYGKVRKLSMTVNLSDENDYEGGDLMFKIGSGFDGKKDTEVCEAIKKKGSIVVFPSFIHHKISPINSGNRYSLVMWTLGKPFR